VTSLSIRQLDRLPALAWLAEIKPDGVVATIGRSVRAEKDGFFEGTWVGPNELAAIPHSTAVFGSGLVIADGRAVVIPPSHPLERLYLYRREESWLASNSLAWLLHAADVELDSNAQYPPLFLAASLFVKPPLAEIPTTGGPVTLAVYDNFRLTPEQDVEIVGRPREQPFVSFDDYQRRLSLALASARDKVPGYEMVVSLSSGYDSTAVAAVAAPLGCRRAVTFSEGKPVHANDSLLDSGAATAATLGMQVEAFDRLAYLDRSDLPEAEFLATGMSGEDVVMAAMGSSLARALLLTGSEEFRLKGNPYRPGLHRGDLSTTSLTEFRLRVDFVHLPILFFGASEQPSLTRIIESDQMKPYVVAGRYDKPIQRRLAEDAGIARGSFATVKRRASGAIHSQGLAAMSATSVESLRKFAALEGRTVATPRRFKIRGWHRFLLRNAWKVRLDGLVAPLRARQRAVTHHDPDFGSLLFRWAISIVARRYSIAAEELIDEPPLPAGSATRTSAPGNEH